MPLMTNQTAATARRDHRRRRSPARAARPVMEGLEGRQLFAAALALTNPFGLPAADRLIFNQVGNVNTYTPANVVHSQQALTLTNTGDAALSIDSLTLSGPFAFVNPPENGYNGVSIAAGKSLTVTVSFTQASVPSHGQNQTNYTDHTNGGAYIGGSLTINSPTTTKVVALAGYYQQLSNNNEEPSLQTIVNRVAGYQTNLGLSGNAVDFAQSDTAATLYGSEVYSTSWEAANAAAAVTVQQLAAFHTQGNTATLYWYAASNQASHQLMRSTAAQGQTILPTTSDGGTTPLAKSFTPGVAFGFRVDGEYSNDTINVNAGNTGGGGHHFRFFPVVDQAGVAVANTYVVAMDYGQAQAENNDFQDNVYVVSNIRPSGTPDTPTNLTASRGTSPTLTWTASTYAPVAYNVYRAGTATGTYTKLTATPVTTTTYTDTSDNGALAYYRVTAVDATQNPVTESAPASVTANSGPTAASYTFAAVSGVGQQVDTLANVTDATGAVDPTTVVVSQPPSNGGSYSVNATTGQITYTPSSSFTGTETLQYTVADSNGDRSTAGTVTFNVAAPGGTTPTPTPTPNGTLTTSAYIGQTLANTAVVLPVLAADTPATSFDLASLAITSQPGDGQVTANADGTVTYTPSNNYIGGDEFKYTVKDANGTTSSSTTVDVNVGLAIGAGTPYRTLAFTSENKTAATVSLNVGTAAVYFDGTGAINTPKGKTANVGGQNLYVRGIGLTGTTAASTLSIKGKANGAVRLAGVFGTTLGTLSAPNSALLTNGGSAAATSGNAHPAGAINLAGLKNLRLASATNAVVTVGSGTPTTAVAITGNVGGTTYSSAVPVTKLSAATWTAVSASAPGPITAPSINALAVRGEFDADLTLTTGPSGKVKTLGSAKVGPVNDGAWNVAGTAGAITMASTGAGFGGLTVGGSLASFTVAKGDLTEDVTAGSINAFRVAGTFGGNLHTDANTNSITVGGLAGSAITVGTTTAFSAINAENVGTATLRSLKVTGRGTNVFSDSTVIAQTIISAATGQVNAATNNPEGLAARTIRSAVIGVNTGAVRLNAAALASDGSLSSYLTTKGATLGSFTIDIVS